jgi:hypothetical protein
MVKLHLLYIAAIHKLRSEKLFKKDYFTPKKITVEIPQATLMIKFVC